MRTVFMQFREFQILKHAALSGRRTASLTATHIDELQPGAPRVSLAVHNKHDARSFSSRHPSLASNRVPSGQLVPGTAPYTCRCMH